MGEEKSAEHPTGAGRIRPKTNIPVETCQTASEQDRYVPHPHRRPSAVAQHMNGNEVEIVFVTKYADTGIAQRNEPGSPDYFFRFREFGFQGGQLMPVDIQRE